jgi:hypothetical protein
MDLERLVDADEAAELIRATSSKPRRAAEFQAASLVHGASQTRNKPEGEREPWDTPLPARYERRPRNKPGKGPRTVNTPLWRVGDLLDWREALESRPAPERPRDKGRYAPEAETARAS